MSMPVVIEHHMAGSNRCDFTVSAMIDGRRRLLVVEAKGQWHPRLFTAAATQLNDQYASHQDAERQGIYLIFWFGAGTEVAGRIGHGIATPDGLCQKIVEGIPVELRGLLDVVVLDLSWLNADTTTINKKPKCERFNASEGQPTSHADSLASVRSTKRVRYKASIHSGV